MKIQILQEELVKALNSSIRFINTRSTLPILSNFLLIASGSKLKIKATNLEMSISLSIGAKVEEEGSITVPAKTFLELISNLNPGQIEINQDKEQLKISSSNFNGNITTIPANDFPNIPESLNTKNTFNLSKESLSKALNKVLFSTSLDETRPVLNGVLFVFTTQATNSFLDLVSSDGFRLSKKTIKLEKAVEPKSLIIPRNSLLELIRHLNSLKSTDISLEIKSNENQLIVKLDDIYLSTRLIDGAFPDFEKIIPRSSSTTVSLDKDDLSRGVKLASVFAREEGNIIKLTNNSSSLSLTSENSKSGFQKNEIEAKVAGDSLSISFNYKFIEDFLNACESQSIDIKLTDSVSPAIFVDLSDVNFLHIIMPVRIQN